MGLIGELATPNGDPGHTGRGRKLPRGRLQGRQLLHTSNRCRVPADLVTNFRQDSTKIITICKVNGVHRWTGALFSQLRLYWFQLHSLVPQTVFVIPILQVHLLIANGSEGFELLVNIYLFLPTAFSLRDGNKNNKKHSYLMLSDTQVYRLLVSLRNNGTFT